MLLPTFITESTSLNVDELGLASSTATLPAADMATKANWVSGVVWTTLLLAVVPAATPVFVTKMLASPNANVCGGLTVSSLDVAVVGVIVSVPVMTVVGTPLLFTTIWLVWNVTWASVGAGK